MTPADHAASSTSPATAIAAFLGGIRFVVTTPSVWPFAAVPVVVALVLACGLAGLGISQSGRLARWILGEDANAAASWGITVVAWALSLFLAALLALVLAQPLSGWALEAISRKQEERLTGRCPAEPSFLRSLWVGVRCSLFIALAGGLITLVLLPITLLFPPAAVVTVPLKFVTAACFLAWDLVDYPLGLRGQGIRARLRWARANFAGFATFGLLWAAVLIVPGIFLLVLPLGVAGATRLAVASERGD